MTDRDGDEHCVDDLYGIWEPHDKTTVYNDGEHLLWHCWCGATGWEDTVE